jgi:hypothetical protein
MLLAAPPPSSSRQPLRKKPVRLFVIIYEDFLAVERADPFLHFTGSSFEFKSIFLILAQKEAAHPKPAAANAQGF